MEIETTTVAQRDDKPEAAPRREVLVDELLAEGATEEFILTRLRQRNHEQFITKQATLPPKSPLDAEGWAEHKAWHLDPQPVYGELKDFYIAGRAAMEADDQQGFSRQKDLLFKAVGTFLQQEWQKYVAAEAERITAEAMQTTEG